jgi:amino acid transporter
VSFLSSVCHCSVIDYRFVVLYTTGDTGRFLGFLQTLVLATVTVSGPELVSMAAREAEKLRKVMPRVYKAVFWRLGLFFVLSILYVSIVIPTNSKELVNTYATSRSNTSSSP